MFPLRRSGKLWYRTGTPVSRRRLEEIVSREEQEGPRT